MAGKSKWSWIGERLGRLINRGRANQQNRETRENGPPRQNRNGNQDSERREQRPDTPSEQGTDKAPGPGFVERLDKQRTELGRARGGDLGRGMSDAPAAPQGLGHAEDIEAGIAEREQKMGEEVDALQKDAEAVSQDHSPKTQEPARQGSFVERFAPQYYQNPPPEPEYDMEQGFDLDDER